MSLWSLDLPGPIDPGTGYRWSGRMLDLWAQRPHGARHGTIGRKRSSIIRRGTKVQTHRPAPSEPIQTRTSGSATSGFGACFVQSEPEPEPEPEHPPHPPWIFGAPGVLPEVPQTTSGASPELHTDRTSHGGRLEVRSGAAGLGPLFEFVTSGARRIGSEPFWGF
ncbi:hypothetical protein BV20DRAFT_670948 [Pilatotrama ljubarskyi]|nr:hypothetical protein BV20DRAFT_670948 [Pilatotrama ljubarskyi]